jgi:hypothetical protein
MNFNSSIVDNDRSLFLDSVPLGAGGIQDIPELLSTSLVSTSLTAFAFAEALLMIVYYFLITLYNTEL